MMTERFSVEFLLGLFCYGCLLLNDADCVLADPLQDLDVLKSYRVANQRQCRRLCWYRKPCARFSLYDKNDNSRTEGDNCVLHLDEEWHHNLPEGWVEGIASGDGLTNGCAHRPCGTTQMCMPFGRDLHNAVCADMPQGCPVQVINGGTAIPSGRKPGDTANVSCDLSQFIWLPTAADKTITCLETSRWTTPYGQCKQVIFNDPGPNSEFSAELPLVVADGWEACFQGIFAGPNEMSMVFTAGREVVLQIVFRQFFSGDDSSTQGQAVWSGLGADGLQILEKVFDYISIQPGQAFQLSVWVFSDQITLDLGGGRPLLFLNYDKGRGPDLSSATDFSFTQAVLTYVSFLSVCDP